MATQTDNLMLLDTGTPRSIASTDTIELGVDLTLTGTSNMIIGGNLTVSGTTTTIDSQLQTADTFILLNSELTTGSSVAGLVMNVDPVEPNYSITDISSDVITVSTDPSALSAGDFILIQNPANADNAGIFEVLSTSTTTITVDTTPANTVLMGTGLTDDTTTQGIVTGLSITVFRSSITGTLQVAFGSTGALSYTDLALTTSTTLQDAYDNDAGAPATITTNATDGAVLIAGDQKLQITATSGLDVDSVADFDISSFTVDGGTTNTWAAANNSDITLTTSGTGITSLDSAVALQTSSTGLTADAGFELQATSGSNLTLTTAGAGVLALDSAQVMETSSTGLTADAGFELQATSGSNLTMTTAGAGILSLDSAVDMQTSSTGLTADAGFTLEATAADLIVQTTTSGGVDLISAGDITHDANGGGFTGAYNGDYVVTFDTEAVNGDAHNTTWTGGTGGLAGGGADAGEGGDFTVLGGTGGAAVTGGSNTSRDGGDIEFDGGVGGAGFASEHDGSSGGNILMDGGVGGVGVTGQTSGAGGNLFIRAGNAGAAGAGTQGNGGNVQIRGGTGTANGDVNIGTANTAEINMGSTTLAVNTIGGIEMGERSTPTNAANTGFLYVMDDSGDTELYYLDDSNQEVQITLDGALNIGALTHSLDDAYNDGSTVTVDTGSVILNGSITSAIQNIEQQSTTTTVGAVVIDYAASAFTGRPHALVVDLSTATSFTNAADVDGLQLTGATNAGAGDSRAIGIDGGWDQGIENASSLVQSGTASFSNTFTHTGSTFDVSATAAVTIDSSGSTIGIGTDAVAQAINIGTGAAARTISIGNETGATALDIDAGTGGVTIDAQGAGAIGIGVQTDTGAINIGTGASARTVSVGTGAAAMTVTVGSNNTTSTTVVDAGSGGMTLDSDGAFTLDAEGAGDFDFAGAVTIDQDTASSGDGYDFTITGSDGFVESSARAGGDISITSGTGSAATSAAGGRGGGLTLDAGTGGIPTFGTQGGGAGGIVSIDGGPAAVGGSSGFGGLGGNVDIAAGVGGDNGDSFGNQPGIGGAITLTAGAGGTDNFTGGGIKTSSSGGAITGTAGAGSNAVDGNSCVGGGGGAVDLTAGAGGLGGDFSASFGFGGVGGGVSLAAGVGGAGNGAGSPGTGGVVSLISGTGGESGGTGTPVTGRAGNPGGALTLDGGTGGGNAFAAAGTAAGGVGGAVTLSGGSGGAVSGATTTNTGGSGGAISLAGGAGGSATNAGTNDGGDGGDANIDAGVAAGTGTDGDINIGTTTGVNITIGDGSATTVAIDAGTTITLDSNAAETVAVANLINSTKTDGAQLFAGTSTPGGSVTGNAGSLFLRDADGSSGVYINTSTGSGTTWTQLASSGGSSLQTSYEAGETIAVDSTNGTLAISGSDQDAQTIMSLTGFAHTGGTPTENLLLITSDDLSAGYAVTINNIGGGAALDVQDNGTSNLLVGSGGSGAVTISPTSGQTATITAAGAGNVDVNLATGAFTVDTADGGSFSIDATGAPSNLSLASTADADDLTIEVTGANNASLVLQSAGTGADAIIINASVGGIDIDSGAGMDINATSAIDLTMGAASTWSAVNGSATALVIDDGTTAFITVDTAAGTVDRVLITPFLSIDTAGFVGTTDGTGVSVNQVVALTDGGLVQRADADSATAGAQLPVGVAANAAGASSSVAVTTVTGSLVSVTFDAAPGATTNGSPCYLDDTTVGAASLTAPSASGSTVFRLGIVQGADGTLTTVPVVWMPQFIAEIP